MKSIEKLQTDLDKFYDWTQYSLLKFHPDKCVVVQLMPSKSEKLKSNVVYNMDERRLKTVPEEKVLGISFNLVKREIDILATHAKVNKANSLVGML